MRLSDLRSDTVTKPTDEMKKAMMEAPLGDDVLGDDPTVKQLEQIAAERSGKECGLFVPSGTMANLLALRIHTQPGDEVIMDAGAHPFNYEAGGAAAFAGLQIRPLQTQGGILNLEDVETAIRPPDHHFCPATLLCVEDTANRGGGAVYPLDRLDELTALAHSKGLATHLDGARVFNAVVASGISLARRAQGFDTVSFCFSKGLGAPVGSVLCGTKTSMQLAHRMRKLLGGSMRQAGILAAAAIYALEHHVDRLKEDHERALTLAKGLQSLGFSTNTPETNMVYVEVENPPQWEANLGNNGVQCFATGASHLRLVTHLDVNDADIQHTIDAFNQCQAAG